MDRMEIKIVKSSPWPWILIAMLVFQASMCMVGVAFATRDRSFAVETDYHRKAVDWDRVVARQRSSQRMGWHSQIHLNPLREQANEPVLSLHDERNQPINDASITVQYFHHARASDVREATLQSVGNGNYRLATPLNRDGKWEFRVVARAGDAVFTEQLLVDLALPKLTEAIR